MMKKSILAVAISATVLLSSVAQAQFIGSKKEPTIGVITTTSWVYKFNYNDAVCKSKGFDAGMITINGRKLCSYSRDTKVKNANKKSNPTWKKKVSTTNWLECPKGNSSCSQSMSTGKNQCFSSGSSVTNTTAIGSSATSKILGVEASVNVTKSVAKTKSKGTSICASEDVRASCTVNGGRKVRLRFNAIMQRWKGDVTVGGYKMRALRTTKGFEGKKVFSDELGYYNAYGNRINKTITGGVEMNNAIRREGVCETQKL